MVQFVHTMQGDQFLDARPATELCQLCKRFQSKITLSTPYQTLDPRQVMTLMAAGIKPGDELTFKADGPDEEDALDALMDFVERKM